MSNSIPDRGVPVNPQTAQFLLRLIDHCTFRSTSEAVESAEANFARNNFFLSQYDAYEALALIEMVKDLDLAVDAEHESRANALIAKIRERCPVPELTPGIVLTYEGPIQIGDCLWICSEPNWPPLAREELVPGLGFGVFDLSSLTRYRNFKGIKAFRESEQLDIAALVEERFSPESVIPNGNIKIRRKGNAIEVVSPNKVSHQIQTVIDSGERRIFAVRTMLAKQLERNELTGDEETQAKTDLAALEAKVAQMERDKK